MVLASKSGRGYHVSLDEAARAREWLQSMLARVEEHPVEVRLKLGYVAGLIMAGQRNLDSADIQAWLQYASLANSATDAQWYASEETLGVLQAKTVACQRLSTSLEKMQILFSADRLTQLRESVRGRSEICAATGECKNTTDSTTRSPRPLFVLGLPRSGTTLLESILGAHKDVLRLGEVRRFGRLGLTGLKTRTTLML